MSRRRENDPVVVRLSNACGSSSSSKASARSTTCRCRFASRARRTWPLWKPRCAMWWSGTRPANGSFRSHGGPVQRVLDIDEVSLALEVRECGDEAELRAAVRETAAHAFDLASDIPIRTWLLREPGGVCVLVLLLHHIAADGWSLGPLFGDLSTAYAARTRQAAPDWAPLPFSTPTTRSGSGRCWAPPRTRPVSWDGS
ncbi:hypothetical protein E4K10_48175 [Streptomyces sp. T1317-0309]|nr:hypothetical protein E4K10_48175 [Streptomyces sp. T1317-0309]